MDPVTLARINLFAVLRSLEELPAHDPTTAELIAGKSKVVQFAARRVGTVRLAIGPDAISHHVGAGPADIKLGFPSPTAVNKMFDGTGNPIPLKGLRQIKFLTGPFTDITNRLEHYLKPTEELLADEAARAANADLTLHLAGYSMAEIGNHDPVGRESARRMADGDILLAVADGPALTLNATAGKLKVRKQAPTKPRAKMVFADLESAGQVLRGEMASYTAIGRDLIELGGYVPMLDNMNKILGLVPRYLG